VSELAALFASQQSTPNRELVMELVISQGMPEEVMLGWREQCRNGVSGYMYHTVPAVVEIGMNHDWNYEQSIAEVIKLGGDTDTTAAILGGLCGVLVANDPEANSIPQAWVDGIMEYPRSVKSMRLLACRNLSKINSCFPFAVLARNCFFLLIVLSHGFMRPFLGFFK